MQKFAAIAALASVVAAEADVPKSPSQRLSAQPKQKATEKPASSLAFEDRMAAIDNAASNGGNVQLEEQKMLDHQNGDAKKYQHDQDFDYGDWGNMFGYGNDDDEQYYDERDHQGYNDDYDNQGYGNLGGLGDIFGNNELGKDFDFQKLLSQLKGQNKYDEDVADKDLVNEAAGEEHNEAEEAKKAEEQQKAETKRSPSFLRGDKNAKVVSPYAKEEDKTADAKTAQTAGGEIASKIKDEIVNAAPAAVASAAAAA